jgi:hypothetical protein
VAAVAAVSPGTSLGVAMAQPRAPTPAVAFGFLGHARHALSKLPGPYALRRRAVAPAPTSRQRPADVTALIPANSR